MKKTWMNRFGVAFGIGAFGIGLMSATAFCGVALAASDYPTKRVDYIVPYRPGGLSDTIVRAHAQALERILGEKIVVKNITGGGGAVGFVVAKAEKPDGYTLAHASSDLPRYRLANLAEVGAEDFDILGGLAATSPIVLVRSDSSWKSLEEFVAAAKKSSSKMSIGVSDLGGYHHLPMLLMEDAAGFKAKAIAHQGSADNTASLLGGHVDLIVGEMAPAKGHIQQGKLRLLATFGTKRLAEFPNVPTVEELYGVNWLGSLGWGAPKGLPADVKKKLAETNAKVWSSPDFVKRVEGYGFEVLKLDGDAYAASLEKLKGSTAKALKLMK